MNVKYFESKNLESFIAEIRSGKRLVCFGAGRFAEYSLKTFLSPNGISPEFYLDNNKGKHSGEFYGYSIKPPEELLRIDSKNTIVLITTLTPFTIMEQITQSGIFGVYASCFFFEGFMGKHYVNISMK